MKIFNTIALTLVFAASLYCAGCASPGGPDAMIARADIGVVRTQGGTVSITVTGGEEDVPGDHNSQISNRNFANAVGKSIAIRRVFEGVSGFGMADYKLVAYIVRIDHPWFGADMTVTLEVNWKLSSRTNDKTLWQKTILTNYTATVGDAFVGAVRGCLAKEGAVRTNIEQALAEIAKLEIGKGNSVVNFSQTSAQSTPVEPKPVRTENAPSNQKGTGAIAAVPIDVDEKIVDLTDATFDAAIAKGIVLVEFTSSSAPKQDAVLQEVAQEVGNSATVARLDLGSARTRSSQFNVKMVPTFILFKDGTPISTFVGSRSKKVLLDAINDEK